MHVVFQFTMTESETSESVSQEKPDSKPVAENSNALSLSEVAVFEENNPRQAREIWTYSLTN